MIWKKTGLQSWLLVDKMGTFMAAGDVVTPEEVRTTQVHEVSDSESAHSEKSANERRPKGAQKARNLNSEFTVEWKRQVDGKLHSLEKSVRSLDAKHSQSHRMMKLMLTLQGVQPTQLQAALDGSDDDHDLFGDDAMDANINVQPKKKWQDAAADPVNAADMPLDVMKAEVCALYPTGAAQAMKLCTRSELVHVLAQLYQHGVFICTTADKAKKEKGEPQLFDDEVVVVPLRVACRAVTEGCVILTQKDKQDAVLWNIPPWRENAGVVW